MKARVVVTFGPRKDETGQEKLALEVKGVWEDGGKAVGDLDPMQALALLDKARSAVIASTAFEPPSLIASAPASALKVLGRGTEVN